MVEVDLPLLRTSERAAFKRCQQRWFWQYRMGYKTSLIERGPLWFGTGFHLAFAEYYIPGMKRGRDPRETWEEYCIDSVKVMVKTKPKTEEAVAEYEEALPLGIAMLDYYLEKWGADEGWDIVAPEQTFAALIRDPRRPSEALARYVGTFDAIYRNAATGKIWLLEHKTASQLRIGHLPLDDQAGTYIPMATHKLRQAGILGCKEQISGIMYNILLKRKPHVSAGGRDAEGRHLNKDGSVSKVQPQDTLRREPVKRTLVQNKKMIERIQTELLQMEQFRQGENLTKNPTYDCGWDCDFFDMCKLHEAGGDVEDFVGNVMKVEDPYMDHRHGAQNTKESLAITRELKGL